MMDGDAVTCRFCTTLCKSDRMVMITKQGKGWFAIPKGQEVPHYTCPTCGRGWWSTYTPGLGVEEHWTADPDYTRIDDPVIRERVRTMMMGLDEQRRIWEEIQKEAPDFSLLDNELKEVCISIAEGERDWYPNSRHLMRIETTDRLGGNGRCVRTIYDIELALRVRHAMRSYIARIIEAQRRQRGDELNSKIAKYDAMVDSDRGE